jgi:hypothetical protein
VVLSTCGGAELRFDRNPKQFAKRTTSDERSMIYAIMAALVVLTCMASVYL